MTLSLEALDEGDRQRRNREAALLEVEALRLQRIRDAEESLVASTLQSDLAARECADLLESVRAGGELPASRRELMERLCEVHHARAVERTGAVPAPQGGAEGEAVKGLLDGGQGAPEQSSAAPSAEPGAGPPATAGLMPAVNMQSLLSAARELQSSLSEQARAVAAGGVAGAAGPPGAGDLALPADLQGRLPATLPAAAAGGAGIPTPEELQGSGQKITHQISQK